MKQHRRIAFAGDWHANTRWACTMIEHAKEQGADCVVHLGDYGYSFTRSFLKDIQAALYRTKMTLYFVDGNHEDFDRLHAFPLAADGTRKVSARVFHLPRGHRFQWAGLRFLACGGGVSVDRHRRAEGKSWWPQEEITADDIARCESDGHTDVLLSHDCPAGVDIPFLGKTEFHFPPDAIRRSNVHRTKLLAVAAAAEPSLIFHGHYHRAYTTRVDLGWGPVRVQGLDCDGMSRTDNMAVYDIGQLRELAGLE